MMKKRKKVKSKGGKLKKGRKKFKLLVYHFIVLYVKEVFSNFHTIIAEEKWTELLGHIV